MLLSVQNIDQGLRMGEISQQDREWLRAARVRRWEESCALQSEAERSKGQLILDLIRASEEIEERARTKSYSKIPVKLIVSNHDLHHLSAAEAEVNETLQKSRRI